MDALHLPARDRKRAERKGQLWATLALLYPMLIFGVMIWSAPTLSLQTLALFVIALAGIPVYAVTAVALGVFACDPLAQDARAKVRVSYLYLYMRLVKESGQNRRQGFEQKRRWNLFHIAKYGGRHANDYPKFLC